MAVDKTTGPRIAVVLFDYGGVLAEEGFREGLKAVARAGRLEPERFFQIAADSVYDSGYVTGDGDEAAYWRMVKQRTGVAASDEKMRTEILDGFVLRPWMLSVVRRVRENGCRAGILSDQTDWLDWLDRRDGFFREFDCVFNSYRLGLSKRDPAIFRRVAEILEVAPHSILFIDDNPGNVERAAAEGFQTIRYKDRESFLREMESFGLWP